jgi:hypothetical protein
VLNRLERKENEPTRNQLPNSFIGAVLNAQYPEPMTEIENADKESIKYAMRRTMYQGSTMVNICDLDLVGTTLEQGELAINLTKEYFQQEVIEYFQAENLLQKCDIANLVGENIVKQAIDLKLAKQVSIKRIANVPFLMIFKFQHGR